MRQRGWMFVFAVVLALGASLHAHMKLAKSSPPDKAVVTLPPAVIQMWFTQAPDLKVSKLDVTGPTGPIKLTDLRAGKDKSITATVAATLPDAAYTVAWQAAGDDGHIQKGTFTFSVKRGK